MFCDCSDPAWRLAVEMADALPDEERLAVYTNLAVGDTTSAVATLLDVAVRDGLLVPVLLLTELTVGLDRYAGSTGELLIRELLSRVDARAG